MAVIVVVAVLESAGLIDHVIGEEDGNHAVASRHPGPLGIDMPPVTDGMYSRTRTLRQ